MSASLSGEFNLQEFTDLGTLAANYRLYTYVPSTTTLKTAYTDAAGSVPHTYTSDGAGGQYIALNARGELPAPLFLLSGGYDLTLKTAAGATVWTRRTTSIDDGGATLDAVLRSDLASSSNVAKGGALVGYNPTLNYAANTLGWANNQDAINAAWFSGVDLTGATDSTAGLASAIALGISTKRAVYLPGGSYLLNGGSASPDGFKNGVLIPYNGVVNFDPTNGFMLFGDQGRTVLKAGADNMIVLRIARNCVSIKDITIEGNGHTNVWGRAVVPEDMTQTSTLVSNSFCTFDNVSVENCTEGLVFQPGPHVGGADSGGFYHRVFGGLSNSNTRHVWFKKNADWGTFPNKTTRTSFFGFHCLRGNTGYQWDAASEIELHGCTEELISSGTSPNATPCARVVPNNAGNANIKWFGGYSEACTTSVNIGGTNLVQSYSYSFTSSSDVANFLANATSYDDYLRGNTPTLTPVLQSSGGGSSSGGTLTGFFWRMGKICFFKIDLTGVGKGTLAVGSVSISGLPASANANMGQQRVAALEWSGITTSGVTIAGFISAGGSTLNLIKSLNGGGSSANLTVAELGATISLQIQGFYITD